MKTEWTVTTGSRETRYTAEINHSKFEILYFCEVYMVNVINEEGFSQSTGTEPCLTLGAAKGEAERFARNRH